MLTFLCNSVLFLLAVVCWFFILVVMKAIHDMFRKKR